MKYHRLITVLAILALFALVGTAVFVYLPGNITISPVGPPVVFDLGDNAGGQDLGGNTITVTLGANKSSFTLTIHPTYQKTYYHNVTIFKNPSPPSGDNYYFGVKVTTPISGPYSSAKLYVYSSGGTLLFTVDLTASAVYGWPTLLSDGDWVRIDVEVVLPEGVSLPGTTTVTVEFVYSPQSAVSPP